MPKEPVITKSNMNEQEAKKSLCYAFLCYLCWGLFPLYWAPLQGQPIGTDQTLAQRIIWSTVFVISLIAFHRNWQPILNAFKSSRVLLIFFASACVLSINWIVYLWGITHNHVLDTSLGYFISPLFNIALGWIFLGDRLSRIQYLSAAMAAIGVLWLVILSGNIPWVALGISSSWGVYSLLHKKVSLPALPSLALETLLMTPFALAYLLYHNVQGSFVFSSLPALPIAIIIGSGIITAVPLLLFAHAAHHINLSTLGMLQYVSPTCQFLLGLFVFHESFYVERFIGYLLVWIGVALFAYGSYQIHLNQVARRNLFNPRRQPNRQQR